MVGLVGYAEELETEGELDEAEYHLHRVEPAAALGQFVEQRGEERQDGERQGESYREGEHRDDGLPEVTARYGVDKDIADDTTFYIFGNGKSTTKREMVDKQFNFTADCFLLGVWHFLIRERSDSNCIGRDTLADWYGTSTETYGKSQIGTELRRNVWEPLGREIRVIPSERTIVKEEKAVSQDNAEQEHKLFVYDMDSLSEEEQESLERLKKSRILRDLLRACHIGTCDKKNDDNKDDNNYAENYELFVMALKRCELLVLNNNNAGRIKEDVITLCKRLEKFIKLIKQKDTNNSFDKSYSAYNNMVKQKITSRKEVLDRVYTTLYGIYPVFSDEQLSDLLSVAKI